MFLANAELFISYNDCVYLSLCFYFRRAYKPPNREAQSGNAFYNRQQQQQQQQQHQQNAFYRNNKRYRTKDFGPVRWDSPHTQHVSAFDPTRPPPMSMPPPTAIPTFQPTAFAVPPPMASSHYGSTSMFHRPPFASDFNRSPGFNPSQMFGQAPPPPPAFKSEPIDDLRPPGVD
jgi:hypothetical protein